ncbi:hypothetical protein JCM1840_002271 [Sporobolomyces johnsonii]
MSTDNSKTTSSSTDWVGIRNGHNVHKIEGGLTTQNWKVWSQAVEKLSCLLDNNALELYGGTLEELATPGTGEKPSKVYLTYQRTSGRPHLFFNELKGPEAMKTVRTNAAGDTMKDLKAAYGGTTTTSEHMQEIDLLAAHHTATNHPGKDVPGINHDLLYDFYVCSLRLALRTITLT